MAEAIGQIDKYAAEGKPVFETSELVQVWIVHHLQILGEAARGVSEASQTDYPDIPWSKIIGSRNILVNHYFAIDPLEIWRVVMVDLPPVKKEIDRILKK